MRRKQHIRCSAMVSGMFFVFFALTACQSDPPDVTTDEQSLVSSLSSPFALPPEDEKSSDSSASATRSSLPPPQEEKPQGIGATAPQSPLQRATTGKTAGISELSATELQEKGTALAKEGNFKDARILLAYALRKEPENLITLNNLGLVLRKMENLDEALKTYQFALQVDAGYALTYKNLGILLEKRGDKELAVQAYRNYCLLAPDAEDVKQVRARADWLEGKE